MLKQSKQIGRRATGTRGSVLIFAVVILSILTMLGVTFLLLVRQSGRASRNSISSIEAEAAAQSGLTHAETVIKGAVNYRTIYTPAGTFWNPLSPIVPLPPGTQVSTTHPYVLEIIPNEGGTPEFLPGAPAVSPLQQFMSPAWNEEPADQRQSFALLMQDPAFRAPHFTVAPLTLNGGFQDRAWRYPVGTTKFDLENFYKNPQVKKLAQPNPIRGQYYVWVQDLDSKLNASAPNLGIDTSRMLNMPASGEVGRQIYYELRDLTPDGELGDLTDDDIDAVLSVMPAFQSQQDLAMRLDSLADPNVYLLLRSELDRYLTVHLDNERAVKPLPGALNINTANLETIAAALSQIPGDLPGTTLKETDLHIQLATRIIEKRPFLSRIDFEDFLAAHLVDPYRTLLGNQIPKRAVDPVLLPNVSELTLSQFMEMDGLQENDPIYKGLNSIQSMIARFSFFSAGVGTGLLSVRTFNNVLNSVSSPLLTDDDIQVHQVGQSGTIVVYPGLDSLLRVSPDPQDDAVEIIIPGPDGVLNSIRAGTDKLVVGDANEASLGLTQFIIPANGVPLQSLIAGDDQKIAVIFSGTDGIAQTRVASYFSNKQIQTFHDVQNPAGNVCTIVLVAGANGSLEITKAVGDDLIVDIILPGPDKILQSSPSVGDEKIAGNLYKEKAAGYTEFILPGLDNKMTSVATGDDILTKAVISGPNGIPETGLFHFSYYSHDTAPQDYMPILSEPYKTTPALAGDPAYVGKFVYGNSASNFQPQNAAFKNYTLIDLNRWSCIGNGERSGYYDMYFNDDTMLYKLGEGSTPPAPPLPEDTPAITPGADNVFQTAPGTDDLKEFEEGEAVTAEDILILPGPNGSLETIPGFQATSTTPDDKRVDSIRVGLFSFTEPAGDDILGFTTMDTSEYILPGPNGVLDTPLEPPDPEDLEPEPEYYDAIVAVIIDGGNGVCDTKMPVNDDYFTPDTVSPTAIAVGGNSINDTYVWGPIRASQRRQDQFLPANATQVPSARISDGKFGNGDVAWSPAFAYHSRFFGIYVLGQSLLRGYTPVGEPGLEPDSAAFPVPEDYQKALATWQKNKAAYDGMDVRANEISGEKRLEAVYDAAKDKIIWQRSPITEKHSLGDPD